MDSRSHFLAVFLKHQTDLKAFIRSVVPRAEDADDLLQEVALVCWEKFDEYDESRSFGAWARGIAAKKLLQMRRQNRRAPTPFSPEAIEAVVGAFETQPAEQGNSRQVEALDYCVSTLQDHGRRLLRLRYSESLSLAELAARVNMQPEAVQKALFRIRKRLQECVRRRLDGMAVFSDEEGRAHEP